MKKNHVFIYILAVTLFFCFMPLNEANAAGDIFAKFEGIKGESTERQHRDWIDVQSVNIVTERSSSATAGTTARTAAAANISFTMIKPVDRATPFLFDVCASGKLFRSVTIDYVATTGASKYIMMKITMTNVRVLSISQGFDAGAQRPVETVTLDFGRIEYRYTPVEAGGKPGAPVIKSWDFGKNSR